MESTKSTKSADLAVADYFKYTCLGLAVLLVMSLSFSAAAIFSIIYVGWAYLTWSHNAAVVAANTSAIPRWNLTSVAAAIMMAVGVVVLGYSGYALVEVSTYAASISGAGAVAALAVTGFLIRVPRGVRK